MVCFILKHPERLSLTEVLIHSGVFAFLPDQTVFLAKEFTFWTWLKNVICDDLMNNAIYHVVLQYTSIGNNRDIKTYDYQDHVKTSMHTVIL